jgi:hypothetical protein
MKEKPKSVTEEVVTELSGTFQLPRGKHLVRLVKRNTIDGTLESISVTTE